MSKKLKLGLILMGSVVVLPAVPYAVLVGVMGAGVYSAVQVVKYVVK